MRIANPILGGFHPDPSICRVGEDYFLATSSFEFLPGIPLYRSRDLVHWQAVGHAFPGPGHLDLAECTASKGLWAPTLRHIGGRFHVVVTLVRHRPWPALFTNLLTSAPDITGPWTTPIEIADGGIDPDLFQDADGTVWYSQGAGLRSAPIDLATGRLLAPLQTLWEGTGGAYPEAPRLFHIDGRIYATLAEGGTGMGHAVTMARAERLPGPFIPCPHNPVVTARGDGTPIQSCGHADLVQAADGSWWSVCLGVRDADGISHLGRETFLMPVRWEHGWPIFGEAGRVPASIEVPFATNQKTEECIADNFHGPAWLPAWNTRLGWGAGHVARSGGRLVLTPTAGSLDEDAAMAWVGMRQTQFNAAAEVVIDVPSIAATTRAGLTVFLDPMHHYDLRVERDAAGPRAVVRIRLGAIDSILGSVPCPDRPVRLRIVADAKRYAFHLDDSPPIASADTRFLGSVLSPGFTGTYMACFAEHGYSPVNFHDWKMVAQPSKA